MYVEQGGYQWLAQNTRLGKVSRQEWVSMLPVFMLGIQAHHAVLDLCASPGSKTTQAVDALWDDWVRLQEQKNKNHKKRKQATAEDYYDRTITPPPGFVIANEIDPPRSYILANRCRQTLRERHVSLAVVQHNATKFPNAQAPLVRSDRIVASLGAEKPTSWSSPESSNSTSKGIYDRIICDVPCSGDGTLRKDLKVWNTWHPTFGIQELHALQLRIAKRGIALLKIGGIMTYSTCSFHAIENEAVVAALLQTKCVELIPPTELERCSELFRNMRYRPGLTDWKVYDDEMRIVPREDAAQRGWPESLWPPKEAPLSLSQCVRMVPHDNDTGGFFIAALRKVRDFERRPSTKTHPSCQIAGGRARLRAIMVTPQSTHHQLYPVAHLESTDKASSSPTRHFRRGVSGGSTTNANIFELANSLSAHLTQLPGSRKLNLVTAGFKKSTS